VRPLAVVTGGSRGLGFETARQLAARGYEVLLTATHDDDGAEAARRIGNGARHVVADVTDPAGVARIAAAVDRPVRILVNNAGVGLEGFDAYVARRTTDVNTRGALAVTEALLPKLDDDANIVMVSSGMGELAGLSPVIRARFADPDLDRDGILALIDTFVDDVAAGRHAERGWPTSAYRVSKAALNALVRWWAPRLPRGIRINAVCPGWVRTDMGGPSAPRSVEEGAAGIVWLATDTSGATGGFFRDGRPIPW
jgi:carbonyl reductase 1